MDRACSLPEGRSEAVGTGVTSADDDDVAALCVDGGLELVALLDPVRARQVVHGLVHAGQVPSGYGQVPTLSGTAGEYHCVIVGPELLHRKVHPHRRVGPELRALGFHLRQAPVEVTLFHLELGDPVPQQAPDAVRPLEHHHDVPCPGELLGRR